MKRYYCIFLLSFLLCNVVLADSNSQKIYQYPCDIFSDDKKGKFFLNDNFVGKVSKIFLAWKKINLVYKNAKITQEQEPDPHYPQMKNFIITMVEGKDSLSYYLSGKKSTPLCASISSPKLNMHPSLFIGQPLSDFQKKFSFNEDVSVLTINTIEDGAFVKLFFANGKLVTIVYKLYGMD